MGGFVVDLKIKIQDLLQTYYDNKTHSKQGWGTFEFGPSSLTST